MRIFWCLVVFGLFVAFPMAAVFCVACLIVDWAYSEHQRRKDKKFLDKTLKIGAGI